VGGLVVCPAHSLASSKLAANSTPQRCVLGVGLRIGADDPRALGAESAETAAAD
jgi:hypothetical protein